MSKILLVVEGEGDGLAMPILTRRILGDCFNIFDWHVDHQRRRGLCHLRANNWAHFKRYLQAAYNEDCRILWTIDADDDCAWEAAREISAIVNAEQLRQPFAVAFWAKEFESIFLYDFDNTRTKLGIPTTVEGPDNPEGIRGAKEWISRHLPKGKIYKEMTDQPRLAATVDLNTLDSISQSFQHFRRAVEWLVNQNTPAVYPIKQ